MDLKYLQNVVWYIEASSSANAASSPKCGSAVAIWLKHKDDHNVGQRYLLTTAHVVRGVAKDGAEGAGPLYDQILAWKPGKGYTRVGERTSSESGRGVSGSIFAKPVERICVTSGDLPDEARAAADDWILLQVDDVNFKNTAHCIYGLAANDVSDICIVGYPGCAGDWRTGDPVVAHHSRSFRLENDEDGVLHLVGPEESEPGMSGGGVFDQRGRLVGIHRSKAAARKQFRSISAKHIAGKLSALDYTVIEPPVVSGEEPERPWPVRIVLGLAIALLITLVVAFYPPVGDKPIPIDNAGAWFSAIAQNAMLLPTEQFSEFRTKLTSPDNAHLHMASLAIVDVKSDQNAEGDWTIVLVPNDCGYVGRTKGELVLHVDADLLPGDFHPSSYSPSNGQYRVADAVLTVTSVIWGRRRSHGEVYARAKAFDTQGKLNCRGE